MLLCGEAYKGNSCRQSDYGNCGVLRIPFYSCPRLGGFVLQELRTLSTVASEAQLCRVLVGMVVLRADVGSNVQLQLLSAVAVHAAGRARSSGSRRLVLRFCVLSLPCSLLYWQVT